jgi:hypothetical protein
VVLAERRRRVVPRDILKAWAARSGLLATAVFMGAGCAHLSTITLGECGNGVTESPSEDCDGAAPKGSHCGAPSTAHGCRFVCDASTGGACPVGFACGLDGVCRTPSSAWSTTASTVHSVENPLDLTIADADKDGRGDVFEQTADAVVFHYDLTSSAPSELSVARDNVLPALGPVAPFAGDGFADAVIPSGLGYFVSLGNASRIDRATAYGALPLPQSATDVQALSADVLANAPGDEVLVLAVLTVAGNAAPALVYVATDGHFGVIAVLPDVPSALAGPVAVGKLNENVSCDELVMGYRGTSALKLFVPCTDPDTVATLVTPTDVQLPKGATIAGPSEIEDLDADGHADLLVVASRNGKYEIDVAYGRGDGTFDSAPGSDPSVPADGRAGTGTTIPSDIPLAVYDLDGDGHADWVDQTGVYLSRPAGPFLVAHDPGAAWTSALIGRFDSDSLPDVVTASNQAPGITVYLNSGRSELTAYPVTTRGSTTTLCAGDFDGDRITDIALVTNTRTSDADDSPDTLSVVFGAAFGSPSAPKDIGEFHRVNQVAKGRVTSGAPSVLDGADDIGALAQDQDGTLAYAVAIGKGDRDLRAPYGFTNTNLAAEVVLGYAPTRLATADVNGDSFPDVIAIADRIDQRSEFRLWSNPMASGAEIQQGQSAPSDILDSSFDWNHVLFGAADLDGVKGDEVVVLGPRSDGTGYQSTIAKASPANSDGTGPLKYRLLGTPTLTDEVFTRAEIGRDPSAFNGRLRTADLDHDGAVDVLALGQRNGKGELLVYFNGKTGALGTPVRVGNAATLDVKDFDVVQADGDPELEVVLLTTTGVYLVDPHGRSLAVAEAPVLTSGVSADLNIIAAGDVDGDGIPDLALAGPGGFDIHLGLSTNPKDAP